MPWKQTDDGAVEVKDGFPVWLNAEGKEIPYDADRAQERIHNVNAEAQRHREEKEALEAKIKTAVSSEDADKLRAELKELRESKNGDSKTAEEFAVLKSQVEQLNTKLKDTQSVAEAAINREHDFLVSQRYLSSALFNSPDGGNTKSLTTLFPEAAQAMFSNHQRVEDGVVVTYTAPVPKSGKVPKGIEPIRSKRTESMGAIAEFDEAIMQLIETSPTFSPRKGIILRSSGADGGGGGGADGPGSSGPKTMTRAAFDKLPHEEREPFIKAGGKLV